VNDISGRYYNDVAIHQWNFYLLHTSHVDYTVFFIRCRHHRCVYILRTTLRSNQHT